VNYLQYNGIYNVPFIVSPSTAP